MFKVKIKFALRRWQPTPVFLSGKYHGPRSLVGYRPWGRKQSDTTERLHFHFHFQNNSRSRATLCTELPWWLSGKESACQWRRCQRREFKPWQEDPLEEGVATHLSILAGGIPWIEEPGRLQSKVLQSQTQLSNYVQSSRLHNYHFLFLASVPLTFR